MTRYEFVRKYLTIFSGRNIIILLFILSSCYLGFSLIYPWIYLREIKLQDLPVPTFSVGTELSAHQQETAKSLDFYVQTIKNRQIWTSPNKEQAKGSGVNVAAREILKNVSLVGVISGAQPQAIIEDKETQKTYYVTPGQFIGEYQIEHIEEGKIILNYNGEKYELYM